MYYAVYNLQTKELHAIETDISAGLPSDMGYVVVQEYVNLQWDKDTLSFIPYPPVRKSILTKKEFIDRFTLAEWIQFVAAKKTDQLIDAAFERLLLLDEVELDGAFLTAVGSHAVSQGYITQERMDEVLA
jgi:hypothetical protein